MNSNQYSYSYNSNIWREDWRDHPEWQSKRFGKMAYVSPVESWPDIYRVKDFHKDLDVNREGKNKYSVTYSRTGRNLGTFDTITTNERTGKRDSTINPKTADQIIDTAIELDRVDPNLYVYDLSSTPQQISTSDILLGTNRVNNINPLLAPYGQGTIQQNPDEFLRSLMSLEPQSSSVDILNALMTPQLSLLSLLGGVTSGS